LIFPGRSLFEWALLMPWSMHAYIVAYTLCRSCPDISGAGAELLHLVSASRAAKDYLGSGTALHAGAIMLLGVVTLSPMVYLTARACS